MSADGNIVRISPGLFQPIAAEDVAAIVADVALAAPRNGIVEIAGPERAPFNEIIARYLKAIGDPREVVRDPEARYWGGRFPARVSRVCSSNTALAANSPGHTHPKSAFIYANVLEGAMRSQVNDGPVTTYKAGQSFSELPGDRHAVSANASNTKPCKLLAVFVVDTNETELTIPLGN